MCGIAGIIGREGETIAAEQVQQMTDAIVHRGPDDEGIYVDGPVGLGMRRLSIIDLSGGHQPIHNEDETVWVVCNGEIYNFPELRSELQSRGHHFYTQSDTEVIVHLYEEMGADCVTKLRGMFAIALYDRNRETVVLARDRLGKKPLHYVLPDGRLLFASEIKAILAVTPDLARIDPQGVLQFFYFGYIPDPRTAFTIQKLPPGHLLEFKRGHASVRRYWDLPAYGTHDPKSEDECLEELEERLNDAVRMRLISDVPLGALLSGGVDSSVVVALMARNSSRPVKTFSISFPHEDFNEAEYARAVAEHFGTEHHEFAVEPDIEHTMALLTSMMEEPFGDSSLIPMYHVCRMARQHVTVALSGDGGDELFAGYDRYQVHLEREKIPGMPGWIGKSFRKFVYPLLPSGARGRRLAFHLSLNARDRFIDSICYLPLLDRERMLLSGDFLAWAGEDASPTQVHRDHFDRAAAPDTLGRLLYLDTKTYLPADILTKVDRMSMACSLEARCPLLDHVLVEWAASLPAKWKMRGGVRKYLLRKLASRVGVPARVLERPKQGFAMPLSHWWRGDLKDSMLALLLEPQTLQRGYFNPKAVRTLVEEHLRGRRNRPTDIWLLLIFELWHRNFLHASGGPGNASYSPSKAARTRGSGLERDPMQSARAD